MNAYLNLTNINLAQEVRKAGLEFGFANCWDLVKFGFI